MSDAQANPYFSANSAAASVNEEGVTDIEDIDPIANVNIPPTIITRVEGKGVPPRRITWPAAATPSVQGNAATSKAPGPTTEEVLPAPNISIENPVGATTTTRTRRKPPELH